MAGNKEATEVAILNSDAKARQPQLVPQASESQAGVNRSANDGRGGYGQAPQTDDISEETDNLNDSDAKTGHPDEISKETEEKWYKECEKFDGWIADKEELDIYQVAAVLVEIWVQTAIKHAEYRKVFRDRHIREHALKALFKVIACGVLQVGGMIYLFVHFMFEQEGEEGEDVDYCRNDKVSVLKLIGVFFAIWISLVVADQMVNVSQSGLYKFGTLQPPFVNNYIIFFGYFANSFVSMACWVTSVALLYFSDNVSDLILNGLAIYFMKTIDDEMVFRHDYKLIEDVFNDYMVANPPEPAEKQRGSHKRHRSGSTIYVTKYIEKAEKTAENEREGCCKADCCGGPCIDNPGLVWVYLSPFIILAPLYLLVCY